MYKVRNQRKYDEHTNGIGDGLLEESGRQVENGKNNQQLNLSEYERKPNHNRRYQIQTTNMVSLCSQLDSNKNI